MIHEMRLNNDPFVLIKNGSKTIEMRLYDDKRRKIKDNDIIVFTNTTTDETIKVKVINLYLYSNFEELYKNFDKISIGYAKNEVANASDMEKYYPQEEQLKYGVVGIEVELLNKHHREIIKTNNINNLEEINLPSSIKNIDELAFWNCESLKKLILPNSIESLENGSISSNTGI